MRDVLIHEYFGIDLELTWQVVQKDIPDLKREIMRIRRDLKTKFSKDKAIKAKS